MSDKLIEALPWFGIIVSHLVLFGIFYSAWRSHWKGEKELAALLDKYQEEVLKEHKK